MFINSEKFRAKKKKIIKPAKPIPSMSFIDSFRISEADL